MNKTITPVPPADFTPTQGNYIPLQPFRFWCQKVMPLVYDDSLSYYELLCKVVDYLNKTMQDMEIAITDIENLHNAYELLQGYVNDYFKNLDVQSEINKKLDDLVNDGTLSILLEPYFTKINNDIKLLQQRVTAIEDIPEGSVTGDVALNDIRIDVTGYTYPTPGDATRGQTQMVLDMFHDNNNNRYRRETINVNFHLGYMSPGGTISPADSLSYSDKIPVKRGDVIRTTSAEATTFRFWTYFNGDTVVPEYGGQNENNLIVPGNVTHIVLTQYNKTSGVVSITPSVIDKILTIGRYNYYTTITRTDTGAITHHLGLETKFNNMLSAHVKNKNNATEIRLGYYSSNNNMFVSIGNNGYTIKDELGGYTTVRDTFELEGADIYITILSSNYDLVIDTLLIQVGAKIVEVENKIRFTPDLYSNILYYSSSNTDVEITYGNLDIAKCPTWLLGDSYISMYLSRWVYYIANKEDILFSGYAGEGSTAGLEKFKSLMDTGLIPRTIVWAYGMNNGDGSTVNTEWSNALSEVRSICEQKNIELVLATIPNTPGINNRLKNNVVRNSGLRYIEFANQVNPGGGSDWYEGMLFTDNVHPTQLGAKALYIAARTACPDLFQ